MDYLARGKRGIVFLTMFRGKRAVVKTKRPESTALNRLANEAAWLHILNAYAIGPQYYHFSDGKLYMEYIEGTSIHHWWPSASFNQRKRVLKDVLHQCYTLDHLQVNKYEMNFPFKHIIIRKGKPVLIDFERCKRVPHPKNVTQFCQYLLKLGVNVNRDSLTSLLKKYKTSYTKKIFNQIVSLFSVSL